jgi:Transposase DNA-binding/Transposase DDE domain
MSEPILPEELALEVASSNFKDERLNARLRSIVAHLAANPRASLPRVFDSAGLEGAYRFFSNCRVTPELILESHFEATRQRCDEEGDFLIVHDSTKFLYRYDGEREGLGRVKPSSKDGQQAFFAHVSLAIAVDGSRRPLGVAGFKTWVRGPEKSGIEYQRWEEQIRSSSARLQASKTAIHVMDREADDYQMFDALIRDGHRFVARCQYNRRLETELGKERLHQVFARVAATIDREVPLTRRKANKDPVVAKIHPARSERVAKLSVAAETVALKRPVNVRPYSTNPPPTVTLNIVRVWEPEPPEGETGVEWYLYTTEPISTPEQLLAIVDYYRARWVIEEYFKAIKSGCDFEKRQLQDYESLVNLLATFAPIAYRSLLLRSEARRTPDASALGVLSSDHIDVLRARGRIRLSENPTVREVYLAVAALGGYIKNKHDPGWSTLGYGLEKLETLTEGWVAAKLQLSSDQR